MCASMKTRLKTTNGTGRINTLVQGETYRNVLVVAAETNRTVSAAIDWLLRRGIAAYSRDNQRELEEADRGN